MQAKDVFEIIAWVVGAVFAGSTVFFAALGWLHRDLLSRISQLSRSLNVNSNDIKLVNRKLTDVILMVHDVRCDIEIRDEIKSIVDILAKRRKNPDGIYPESGPDGE